MYDKKATRAKKRAVCMSGKCKVPYTHSRACCFPFLQPVKTLPFRHALIRRVSLLLGLQDDLILPAFGGQKTHSLRLEVHVRPAPAGRPPLADLLPAGSGQPSQPAGLPV